MKFNIEKALQVVGNNNRYQKLLFVAVALSWFSIDFISISFPLLELMPDIRCKNAEGNFVKCKQEDYCAITNPEDKQLHIEYTNILTDYELYCETNKVITIGVTYALGVLVGAIIASKLSDALGRKPVLLMSQLLFAFGALSLTIIHNIYFVFCILFLMGISVAGGVMVSFLYLYEVLAPNKRSLYGTLVNSSFAIAGLIYFTAYKYFKNWKYIAYLCSVTDIIAFLLILTYFTESPRFLISKGKFEKALKCLHKISVKNKKSQDFYKFLVSDVCDEKPIGNKETFGTKLDKSDVNINSEKYVEQANSSKSTSNESQENKMILEHLLKKIRKGNTDLFEEDTKGGPLLQPESPLQKSKFTSQSVVSEKESKEAGFSALIKYDSVRKNFLLCCFLWFALSFTYYGISLDLKNSDDVFRDGYVVYGAEGISYMVTGIIISISFFGRIRSLSMMILMSALSTACYFFLVLYQVKTYDTIVLFFARFAVTAGYSIMYTYSTEIYPTAVRSKGLGINTLFARASTIIVPVVLEFVNPFAIFPWLCLAGFAMSCFLPETFGKDLEDEILEERLCRKDSLDN